MAAKLFFFFLCLHEYKSWKPGLRVNGLRVARTAWRNGTIELPSAGPKVARTAWRNGTIELPSTGPKVAGKRIRNR